MFVINGEPSQYSNRKHKEQGYWNDAKQQSLKAIIELANQLNYDKPITYPIELKIIFHAEKKGVNNILSLQKFVTTALRKDIVTNVNLVRSITAEIVELSATPRTEIHIEKYHAHD